MSTTKLIMDHYLSQAEISTDFGDFITAAEYYVTAAHKASNDLIQVVLFRLAGDCFDAVGLDVESESAYARAQYLWEEAPKTTYDFQELDRLGMSYLRREMTRIGLGLLTVARDGYLMTENYLLSYIVATECGRTLLRLGRNKEALDHFQYAHEGLLDRYPDEWLQNALLYMAVLKGTPRFMLGIDVMHAVCTIPQLRPQARTALRTTVFGPSKFLINV